MPQPLLERRARFEPKSLETLRPCMVPLIGRVFNFESAGTHDRGPYGGQETWMIAREHDAELPEECRGRWFPDEDLAAAS